MERKTSSSEDLTDLLDRFRRRASDEAQALARQAGETATEAWRSYWRPWEGLKSPAAKAALVGGVLAFATGWLVGRKARVSPPAAVFTAAAVAGGVAAGMLIGAHARATSQEPGSRSQETPSPRSPLP